MAQKSRSRPRTRAERRRNRSTTGPAPRSLRRPFLIGAGALAVLGLAVLMYLSATRQSEVDPELAALASANAGGQTVATHTGTRHTVYHATEPLPTPASPQAEGRPTLVWFSGTWCEFCEHMSPFAHPTAAQFRDRLIFVEKSFDHDRDARLRYAISGTPTFVLIDAEGNELARFGFQRDGPAFAEAIERALAGSAAS